MSKIKMLAMDVDGTMTDGSINIASTGELFKTFDVKDGIGVKQLKKAGIFTVIITGRKSDIVEIRAKELEIDEVIQGVDKKESVLGYLLSKYDLLPSEIAYIGDDVNDVGIMDAVGISFCPFDASSSAKAHSTVILESKGGHGAIRECSAYIIENNL